MDDLARLQHALAASLVDLRHHLDAGDVPEQAYRFVAPLRPTTPWAPPLHKILARTELLDRPHAVAWRLNRLARLGERGLDQCFHRHDSQ